MKRSNILELTGLTVTSFNAMAARGVLGFTQQANEGGQFDYSAEDCFRLALVLALGRVGLTQVEAAELVSFMYPKIKAYKVKNGDALYLGVIHSRDNGHVSFVDHRLDKRLQLHVGRFSAIAIIDATDVLQLLYQRADLSASIDQPFVPIMKAMGVKPA